MSSEFNFQPGQAITCTVAKLPLGQNATDTIARLMRLDHANKTALRTAYRKRAQRMVIYNRGNRDWVKRERTAMVVRVAPGQSWTMPFNFDIARDLASVKPYLTIAAAK